MLVSSVNNSYNTYFYGKNVKFSEKNIDSLKKIVKDKKSYTANFLMNDDYEGYVSFYTKKIKDKELMAHYDIYDIYNPPSISSREKFNADFILNYINQVSKVDKSAETYIKQNHNAPFSTETDVVAEIKEISKKGYKAAINNFSEDINLNMNHIENINVGDKISASGLLDCEFKK